MNWQLKSDPVGYFGVVLWRKISGKCHKMWNVYGGGLAVLKKVGYGICVSVSH